MSVLEALVPTIVELFTRLFGDSLECGPGVFHAFVSGNCTAASAPSLDEVETLLCGPFTGEMREGLKWAFHLQ